MQSLVDPEIAANTATTPSLHYIILGQGRVIRQRLGHLVSTFQTCITQEEGRATRQTYIHTPSHHKTGKCCISSLHNAKTRQRSEADTTNAQSGHTCVEGNEAVGTQTGPETGRHKRDQPSQEIYIAIGEPPPKKSHMAPASQGRQETGPCEPPANKKCLRHQAPKSSQARKQLQGFC